MDFIEKFFGVSPDGGDGSTELMYIAITVVVVAVVFWRLKIKGSIANFELRRRR